MLCLSQKSWLKEKRKKLLNQAQMKMEKECENIVDKNEKPQTNKSSMKRFTQNAVTGPSYLVNKIPDDECIKSN